MGRNRFRVALGHAPGHPEWFNLLQFEIPRHARGNRLRLDVVFENKGDARPSIRFNHDANTWSYDGRNWMPIEWKVGGRNGYVTSDTLEFPEFEEDRVLLGSQVPMAYEDVVGFMEHYGKHPDARVHAIGKSLGGRNIYRLEITARAGGEENNQESRKAGRDAGRGVNLELSQPRGCAANKQQG